jgi:Holliday junction resolvase-like predicted endonuclease
VRTAALLRRVWLARAPRSFARWGRPDTVELGLAGEELAARALRRAGWRVLGRRLTTPHAEVDLVALDGDELVCVEVKAGRVAAVPRPRGRRLPALELRWRPGLRVDRERLERLARAGRWLAARAGGTRRTGGRVDLVEVVLVGNPPRLEVFQHRDLRRPLGR